MWRTSTGILVRDIHLTFFYSSSRYLPPSLSMICMHATTLSCRSKAAMSATSALSFWRIMLYDCSTPPVEGGREGGRERRGGIGVG